MVDREDGRSLGLGGQLGLDPGAALEAERSLLVAGDRRVPDDQPQVAHPGRVLKGLADRPGRRVEGEVLAQAVAVVVVAGEHEHGHRQRREQLADSLIRARRRRVDEVAGDDHRVRARGEREHPTDRGRERGGRLTVLATHTDVGIAELGQERRNVRVQAFGRVARNVQTFFTWS